MSKYELLPMQLVHEGTITEGNLFHPDSISPDWLLRTHDPDYVSRLDELTLTPAEIRRTGFPLSDTVVKREKVIVNGTLLATHFALEYGISMNIAGGTHHAFTNRGEGFCLFNDQAIAANYLLQRRLAKKILIVDLDVHQGNGTAEIFRNERRVFTFSMHGANNYPMIKEESDLDVGLPDGTADAAYLALLDGNLKSLLDTAEPDFIFFQAGVDILETDKLGKLKVTRQGCRQRDKLVLRLAKENRIPIVVTMGGGYSPNFNDIIEAHANTFRLAQDIFF